MGHSVGRLVVLTLCAALSLAACGTSAPASGDAPATPLPAPRTGVPELRVDVVAQGLTQVQDVAFLPDGKLLVTQKQGRLTLLAGPEPGAASSPVTAELTDLSVRGEGGLLGLVVHPDFNRTRRFTTCQTHTQRGVAADVRLVTWELAGDAKSARRVVDPLVGGLPIGTTGQHLMCRPAIAPDGALLVGTGDAGRGSEAQDLEALGGKILRVDLSTGGPTLGNPLTEEANPATRLLLTYGHTNVTGIAIQPLTGQAYSVEVGFRRDDEVNLVVPGMNYGFDPERGGARWDGYDAATPMTDTKLYPKALLPVWTSGSPALGVSGAAFLSGRHWGDLDGRLMVSTTTGKRLLMMRFGPDQKIAEAVPVGPLNQAYGQLSSVRYSPGGDLFVTTSNGRDDKVLRIRPV